MDDADDAEGEGEGEGEDEEVEGSGNKPICFKRLGGSTSPSPADLFLSTICCKIIESVKSIFLILISLFFCNKLTFLIFI